MIYILKRKSLWNGITEILDFYEHKESAVAAAKKKNATAREYHYYVQKRALK